MNEPTFLTRAFTAVVAVALMVAAATIGTFVGLFTLAVLSVAHVALRLKRSVAVEERVEMGNPAHVGRVIEGSYEVVKE